ncbi:MAG: twin-arginine translocase TatA/TatE family subunit [Rhodospirillales bacterium]|nr:twin-arginine translocase TatA/TatE family subunit [Rhodospirillales bacterium]MCB9965884.1 twin-arginine translocase TatA/TatE family subunit [Rhodospirillales bacterium]
MFDFGFSELLLIVIAGIFLVGPKDIPELLKNLGRGVRRLQYVRFAMSEQFDRFMQDNDLNEIRHFSVDPLKNVDEKEADEEAPAPPPAITSTASPEDTSSKTPL